MGNLAICEFTLLQHYVVAVCTHLLIALGFVYIVSYAHVFTFHVNRGGVGRVP